MHPCPHTSGIFADDVGVGVVCIRCVCIGVGQWDMYSGFGSITDILIIVSRGVSSMWMDLVFVYVNATHIPRSVGMDSSFVFDRFVHLRVYQT